MRAVWLVAAVLAVCAQARAGDAADRLRAAANLAREGSWNEAVAALPDASALERGDLPAIQDAAVALRTQRPADSAHLWAAMRRLDPDAIRPRTALESLWADNPTLDGVWAEDLDSYPVECQRNSYGALSVVTLALKPFLKAKPAVEPSSGAAFGATANIYAEAKGRLRLRFLVHAVSAEGLPRARQVGRYLAALADLTDSMLGPANRAAYPVPVWLEDGGSPGARQWNGAITIQAVGHERADAEWVRELSHEWGHACLPGIDGFTKPEAWANGDLGERLFIPLMKQSDRLSAWNAGVDASAYETRYVDAPMNAFAASGPQPKLLANNGKAGYDHFLAAGLYVFQAYGPGALVKALDAAAGGSAGDFLRAFSDGLSPSQVISVTHVGPAGPCAICIPRSGKYSLDGHRVKWNGKPVNGPVRMDKGWTKVDWEGILSLRRAEGSGASSTRNR